ncbi:DUF983 domain-containing protein [Mariluticola halotolerans]|uniref:DUF983 domain-containing protein n=1 Tax=Mariluticola halotolerans TaxID=2909283 RepID=UPI0026E1758C|nr:DUF983 domain-containing protein [Mariluticola halotolerans]UJQ95223.1 DUF983 domain-containing protein [Mariluticola halotolerans]
MSVTVKTAVDHRPVWPALVRGMACKCPNCGEGKLFRAYLKVEDHCANCGEEFSHHRADDLPPYIAILIVGHILVGVMLHMEMTWTVNPMVYMAILVPLAIVMPLAMLPSIKGAVVALQWAVRMHGFDPANRKAA